MPQIKHREDICYWYLRSYVERIIAGVVLLVPCSFMAIYGFVKMDYSSNYALLQIVGWAGILTYVLQFLIVEGIERTEKQVYFFRGPLILGLFWHSQRISMEREKKIIFQHKSKQELGQHFYKIEVRGLQGIHKTQWYFAITFTNRDAVRKMINVIRQDV